MRVCVRERERHMQEHIVVAQVWRSGDNLWSQFSMSVPGIEGRSPDFEPPRQSAIPPDW